MKNILTKSAAMLAFGAFATGTVCAEELTIERLVGSPSISGPSVQGLEMSPDGRRITFLRGKAENQAQLDLWEYDVETGEASLLVDSSVLLGGKEEELSEEEKARRERNRSLTGKSGIVSYDWSADGKALLFPLGGDVFVLPLGGEVKQLTATPEYETDIKFSPEGSYVSFIRDRELYVVNVATGDEIKLTSGATATVANGMSEFVAQEELGRFTGYWWSPNEAYVAFEQFDESAVPVKDRYEVQPDGSVITTLQRYPEAGSTNVDVRLGVASVADQSVRWIDLGEDKDIYLARVDWEPDSSSVVVQRLNRAQTQLDMLWAEADGSDVDVFLSEKSDVWINMHDSLEFTADGSLMIWASERSGFKHLYAYDLEDRGVTALTSGEWAINEIEHVDDKTGTVYFTGYKDSPLEQHLYSVPLNGGEIKRISQEPGWHQVTVGQDVFVDKFSSPDQPPQVMVRNLKDGSTRFAILENKLDASHPFEPYLASRVKTSFGTIKADDGTDLYYRMYQPANMEQGRKYPAVLAPYGGPHGQRVRHDWRLDFNHMLARNGFVVLVLDNRGMANRGLKFESHIKNAMGSVEVADQVAGANFLKGFEHIDGDNIGFWGWSYGGYMTLMALFQAPETFKAGVSVAPVTDWRLYDTAYTERYLGHPDAPGDVYENSSVFKYIDGFKGKLLLIHGMADDNVFFDNSVKLMAALQNKGKPFELMTYPGKKHGIRGEATQAHLYNQALEFFRRTLQGN
ncbi:alpha/beta fold hydrolase [Kordiimonas lipolytica]|uniref:Alpha/beta fold hydrolase n=1 Tax=Kordiimonas lipolytica TaxID=1662421 RepID=A0ABV8UBU6_9PROT|nr:S9 family peptidase [Kordiimonas lipolytica]